MVEAPSAPTVRSKGLRRRLLILLPVVMLAFGGITYLVVQDAHRKIVEFQALEVAEIVARQAAVGRSVYAREVAGKLARDGTGPHVAYAEQKGYIPLPAQFLKMVGKEASDTSDGLYAYQPLSKWNLEPTQGIVSDFQKWAWVKLEAQDQDDPQAPIDWRPIWRFDTVNGATTLRYMRADPASGESCVTCHNALERTPEIIARRQAAGVPPGKTWKRHQLLGAMQVDIPLNKVEVIVASQTRQTLIWILSVVGTGAVFVTWFVFSDFAQTRRMLRLSWLVSHDGLTGLYNSRGMHYFVDRAVREAKSQNNQHALLYVRLTDVKEVTDRYGVAASDQLLRQVAKVLQTQVPENTVLARMQGVEFAVMMMRASAVDAKRMAEWVLNAVKRLRFHWADSVLNIGANIGITIITSEIESARDAMRTADEACVAASKQDHTPIYMYRG